MKTKVEKLILIVCLIICLMAFSKIIFAQQAVPEKVTQSSAFMFNSCTVSYIESNLYFKWTATNVKQEGSFIIEKKIDEEYTAIEVVSAQPVSISAPILYCKTIADSFITTNSIFRIRYVTYWEQNIKGKDFRANILPSGIPSNSSMQSNSNLDTNHIKMKIFDGYSFEDSFGLQRGPKKNFENIRNTCGLLLFEE